MQNRKTEEDPNLKDMEKTNYKVLLKRWIESGFNKTLGLPLVADVLVLNVQEHQQLNTTATKCRHEL